MNITILIFLFAGLTLHVTDAAERNNAMIITTDALQRYVDQFNAADNELYHNDIPNKEAFAFLNGNIPQFECPDKAFERTYYFRWWTYRKHVKRTPDGYVITEFLPQVGWSGKHNTISCPAGHHFYEGRWLHDPRYLDDYAVFWLRKGGNLRSYSFWIADALFARHLVRPDKELLVDLLDDLIQNYRAWEASHRGNESMFFQGDGADGMEVSIGGSGHRATINSYMFADASAIVRIAKLAEREDIATEFEAKADEIKNLVQTKLWDNKAKFFKVLPRGKNKKLADVRELHGYTPWYVKLPDSGKGYAAAWKQLMDPKGFYAPFGPTTAEQRHPRFAISYEGHECQWNGPSWPFATSITLTALANLLNNYDQDVITKEDYFKTLECYTRSHALREEPMRDPKDADALNHPPWIDENLNPYTGDWIARTRLNDGKERGKDYNHSTYTDLIITGLVGLRPSADNVVTVNPLIPPDTWDYFCLDNVLYRGTILTIVWDKTGKQYGQGAGLSIFADGKRVATSKNLSKITGHLK